MYVHVCPFQLLKRSAAFTKHGAKIMNDIGGHYKLPLYFPIIVNNNVTHALSCEVGATFNVLEMAYH